MNEAAMTYASNPFAGLFRGVIDRPGTHRHKEAKPKAPKPQKAKPANPWGLSAAEEAAMRAVCLHGDHEEAARSLGIDHRTVEYHMGQCRKRMGAKNRVLAILEWDRYARGAA